MSEYEYTLETLLRERCALLVIDMQNDFVHDLGAFAQAGIDAAHYQRLVPTIQRLRTAAGVARIPVYVVGMSHNDENDGHDAWILRRRGKGHPDSCRTGTWGALFYDGLEPREGDELLWKHRYSAFVGTDFHERLMEKGIKTLIVTGINTNTCVESTVRDAHLLGYHVAVVSDATACAYADAYEPSLKNVERHFGLVADSRQIMTIWKETSNDVL